MECARYQGGKRFTSDLTDVTANAVMTEYYKPLYDDYHVFYLAFQEGQHQETYMKKKVKEYAEYALNPKHDLTYADLAGSRKSFLTPGSCSFNVSELVCATDNNAKIFEEQACKYEKYKSVEKGIEKLKGSVDSVESLRESTEVVGQKIRCEQEIFKHANEIRDLMRQIDGIEISDNANIYVREQFLKKLVAGEPTMNKLGMSNKQMWIKVKSSCVNVNQLLTGVKTNAEHVEKLLAKQEQLRKKLEDCKDRKGEDARKISDGLSSLEKEKKKLMKAINSSCKMFGNLVVTTKSAGEEALEIIHKLQLTEKEMKKSLDSYSRRLQSGGEMQKELYTSLKCDLEDVTKMTGEGINLEQIEQIVKQNLEILHNISLMDNLMMEDSYSAIRMLSAQTSHNLSLLEEYDTDSISFTYGKENKKKPDNPVDKMEELLRNGIVNLVLEENVKVSKRTMPSLTLANCHEQNQTNVSPVTLMKKLGQMQGTSELFQLFSNNKNTNLLSKALMLMYEEEHFGAFQQEKKKEEERTLIYELEYILKGELSDRENLEKTIEELIMWRTVFNYLSIMTDSEKRAQAREVAIALAGITGIEPLIHVTQTIILIVWSFEEALVDVSAMLKGKSVAIIKKSKTFLITFQDLVLINKSLIHQKEKIMKEEKGGISYHTFLEILTLFRYNRQNRYRCMELISQNLRLRQKNNFSFNYCVSGFSVTVTAEMKDKFSALQFGRRMISQEKYLWKYHCKKEMSY